MRVLRPLPLPSLLLLTGLALSGAPAVAQQAYAPAGVTAAEYAASERYLGQFMRPLVSGGDVNPSWTGQPGIFWYRSDRTDSPQWMLVDALEGSQTAAFDPAAMAATLGSAAGMGLVPERLGVVAIDPDAGEVHVAVDGGVWACDLAAEACRELPGDDRAAAPRFSVESPDGNWAAYQQDWNLWVRDMRTGEDLQLTEGGTEDWGWGTNNAGWTRSPRPVLRWSPDSRKIATFRHDARGVSMMHLVNTQVGAPEHEGWRYPFPGDSVIFRIERVVIDVPTRELVRLDMPIDPHRSTICDHIYCNGTFSDVDWRNGSEELAFVSSSRDHKVATFRLADPETGAVRTLYEERQETFFESGNDNVNWSVLDATDEFLWWSQESNWGHLYLHDLTTGDRIRPITSGDWNVLRVTRVDEENREIFFIGSGREPGDPYFEYFYKVDIDDGDVTLLTPDSAHHSIDLSPDGTTFVDTWSTPLIPAKSAARSTEDGRLLLELESADATELMASHWNAPIPFVTKARDGVTDLHGLMYTPSDLDESLTYPVVNYLYPGPQSGSVGGRSFSPARRDHQALAELGFVVIEVDAMGTPGRSKEFHDAYYGNMGDNGLPDQIATIRQLAERHSFIDLDRVGIWGHSGGGFASTAGILRYPDFYRVAVSQAGNHDNRNYEDDWGEKWQGLLEEYPDGTTSYDNQANQLLATDLRGKLLLAHGGMDSNVPPQNTLLVVEALMEANKDFDLIWFPNAGHGFGNTDYMMRRRWDYFVKHLLGAEPPVEFEFGQQDPPG